MSAEGYAIVGGWIDASGLKWTWHFDRLLTGQAAIDAKRAFDLGELRRGYPPPPEGVTLFQSDSAFGYEEPTSLDGPWEWSTTFVQWGRLVTFRSGHQVFTWPKDGRAVSQRLKKEAIERLEKGVPCART